MAADRSEMTIPDEGCQIVWRSGLTGNFPARILWRRFFTDQLSEQLLKVAHLSAQGLSFKEIARRMDMSPATVRNYLSTIYSKLDIKNKVELVKLLQDSA